jgi:hypothetical protein
MVSKQERSDAKEKLWKDESKGFSRQKKDYIHTNFIIIYCYNCSILLLVVNLLVGL